MSTYAAEDAQLARTNIETILRRVQGPLAQCVTTKVLSHRRTICTELQLAVLHTTLFHDFGTNKKEQKKRGRLLLYRALQHRSTAGGNQPHNNPGPEAKHKTDKDGTVLNPKYSRKKTKAQQKHNKKEQGSFIPSTKRRASAAARETRRDDEDDNTQEPPEETKRGEKKRTRAGSRFSLRNRAQRAACAAPESSLPSGCVFIIAFTISDTLYSSSTQGGGEGGGNKKEGRERKDCQEIEKKKKKKADLQTYLFGELGATLRPVVLVCFYPVEGGRHNKTLTAVWARVAALEQTTSTNEEQQRTEEEKNLTPTHTTEPAYKKCRLIISPHRQEIKSMLTQRARG